MHDLSITRQPHVVCAKKNNTNPSGLTCVLPSKNMNGLNSNTDKSPFHPYFSNKEPSQGVMGGEVNSTTC